MKIRFLLLQARRQDDPMASHEFACIASKLTITPEELQVHNALSSPPPPSLLDHVDALLIGGSGDYSVHHVAGQRWVAPCRDFVHEAPWAIPEKPEVNGHRSKPWQPVHGARP